MQGLSSLHEQSRHEQRMFILTIYIKRMLQYVYNVCIHTHTCAHKHTCTHMCHTHTHTHTHARTHRHTHTDTNARTHRHTYRLASMADTHQLHNTQSSKACAPNWVQVQPPAGTSHNSEPAKEPRAAAASIWPKLKVLQCKCML